MNKAVVDMLLTLAQASETDLLFKRKRDSCSVLMCYIDNGKSSYL